MNSLDRNHPHIGKDTESSPTLLDNSQLDDAALVTACLEGDEQAWVTLLARYNRLIYTIPLRFGFSKAMADEIHQETCLIMLEKMETLRDRQQLSSWIMTVTRRACIKRWRTNKTEEIELTDTDHIEESNLDEHIMQLEAQFLIQESFARLSESCQQLIQALFLTEPPLAYEEIAEQLEISLGSVGPTRARCLDKLRREVERLQRS